MNIPHRRQVPREERIVDLTDFDIIELIKEVINERNFSSKKSHRIVLGEGTQKAQMVKADKDMIRQVIVNLVIARFIKSNAHY